MTANVWVGVGGSLPVTLAIGFFNGSEGDSAGEV